MKTYYCVVSKYFDDGTSKGTIHDIKAEDKPQSTFVEKALYDEYHDYFDTYDEAEKFRKNACLRLH